MKSRLLVLCFVLLSSLQLSSCKDEQDNINPPASGWITMPQYDFPIYIEQRGGVLTTSVESFDVTGFLEVGDPAAYNDSLEWKVLPYAGSMRLWERSDAAVPGMNSLTKVAAP